MKICVAVTIACVLNFMSFGPAYGEQTSKFTPNDKEYVLTDEVKESMNYNQSIAIGGKLGTVLLGDIDKRFELPFTFIHCGFEGKNLVIEYYNDRTDFKRRLLIPLNKRKQALIQPYFTGNITASKFLITVVDDLGSIAIKKIEDPPAPKK